MTWLRIESVLTSHHFFTKSFSLGFGNDVHMFFWISKVEDMQQSVTCTLINVSKLNCAYRLIWNVYAILADDCIVYRPIHDPSDQLIFQQDIDTLLHWSHNWQMNLNAKKCCMLAVSSKRQKHVRSYTLGNVTLLSVESFTYLSHSIFGHEHITAVSAKATHVLNLLPRNINFCNPYILYLYLRTCWSFFKYFFAKVLVVFLVCHRF